MYLSDKSSFQRGFLLSKSKKAKDKKAGGKSSTLTTTTNDSSSLAHPSVSTLSVAGADAVVVEKKTSRIQKNDQTTPAKTALEMKHSDQAKGFSNGKKIKKMKGNAGWSKGFLIKKTTNKDEKKTNNEPNKILLDDEFGPKIERRQKTQLPVTGYHPKRTQSSNVLLSIDDDVQISKRNPARIITKADGTSKSMPITDKPLISVVFEENTDENALRPDSPHQLKKNSTFDSDSNDFRSNSCLEGSTAILSTKSSKTEEDKYKEHTSSSIFLKEVYTTRYSNMGSRREQLIDSEEGLYDRYYQKGATAATVASSDSSNKTNENEEDPVFSFQKIKNESFNILKLQQEIERECSSVSKLRHDKKSIDCHEYHGLQKILSAPEHLRYAWIYILQQKHQQMDKQKDGIRKHEEKIEYDSLIRMLLDAEYFYHCNKRGEIRMHDYENNDDADYPLEQIIQCVETEEDRKLVLQAVLIIQHYFITRYKELHHYSQTQISQTSSNSAKANAQAETNRLIRLFLKVALISRGSKRTVLLQTAWETAILLICFCIFECIGASSLSSLPVSFWVELDLVLHQQLVWQQSKTKLNSVKINHLKDLMTKSKNVSENLSPRPNGLHASSKILKELHSSLENLINLRLL